MSGKKLDLEEIYDEETTDALREEMMKKAMETKPIYPEEEITILSKEAYLLLRKDLEVLEIIKRHKLLNYVLKNKKCADMYKLTEEEINKLKELENDNL